MNETYYWIVGAVAIITLALNVALMIRGGVFNMVSREESMRALFKEELDKLRSETTHNLASINQDLNQTQDIATQRFGETVAALREQVAQNALHSERTFLRREDFFEYNRRSEKQLDTISKQIDDRFNRVEKRLDELSTGNVVGR